MKNICLEYFSRQHHNVILGILLLCYAHRLIFFPLGAVEHQAEAIEAVAEIRQIPAALKHTATPRGAIEATTAQYAVLALFGTLWAVLWLRRIRLHPVATPLHHVASHVVQPQFVGFQSSHGMAMSAAIGAKPAHLPRLALRAGIHRVVSSHTSACRKLPFRLRR